MPLTLCLGSAADASRIAEIHMAAFGSNALLRAQFPTSTVRAALQKSIEQKALADIADPRITVLVVLDADSTSRGPETTPDVKDGENVRVDSEGRKRGRVVSFAKWVHPVAEDEEYVEPPWIWPEGSDLGMLDAWGRKMDEAQEKAIGQTPCYLLNFMGTDPAFERRGAATLMLQWGKEQCDNDGALGYLESTLEAAPFYKKNGFTPVVTFSLSLKREDGGLDEIYEEIAFVYTPKKP